MYVLSDCRKTDADRFPPRASQWRDWQVLRCHAGRYMPFRASEQAARGNYGVQFQVRIAPFEVRAPQCQA